MANLNPWEVKNTGKAEIKCEISHNWWDFALTAGTGARTVGFQSGGCLWEALPNGVGISWEHHQAFLWRCWGLSSSRDNPWHSSQWWAPSPSLGCLEHGLASPQKAPGEHLLQQEVRNLVNTEWLNNPRGFCCSAVDPCLRNLVNGTSLSQGREEKQCIFTNNFRCWSYSFKRMVIQKDTTAERGGNRVSGSLSQPHHGQCLINLLTWWPGRITEQGREKGPSVKPAEWPKEVLDSLKSSRVLRKPRVPLVWRVRSPRSEFKEGTHLRK